jgi:hypothetical protein
MNNNPKSQEQIPKRPTGVGSGGLVSLLERSKCYCHELRNNYIAKHGAGDHTADIVEHIVSLGKMIQELKQAND